MSRMILGVNKMLNNSMMAKHIISIYDMCFSEQADYDQSIWNEKITDTLNYLFLLNALVREEGSHE